MIQLPCNNGDALASVWYWTPRENESNSSAHTQLNRRLELLLVPGSEWLESEEKSIEYVSNFNAKPLFATQKWWIQTNMLCSSVQNTDCCPKMAYSKSIVLFFFSIFFVSKEWIQKSSVAKWFLFIFTQKSVILRQYFSVCVGAS